MSEPARTIRVLLVDDHVAFRESLAFVLDHQPDMRVVAQAGTLQEARAAIIEQQPDIALIDLFLPGSHGADLIRQLRIVNPHATLLVLTGSGSRIDYANAIAAGASGICHKSEPVAQVIDAIRRVCDGETLFALSELVDMLRVAAQNREATLDTQRRVDRLTAREREILQELASGGSDKTIAQHLNISHETVRTHMVSILSKLGVESRLQALLFGIRSGLIPVEKIRPDD